MNFFNIFYIENVYFRKMNVSKFHIKTNVMVALAILFAICYQSLHIFIDNEHHHFHFHQEEIQKQTSKVQVSVDNHEECPVCDFEFAAFLAEDVYVLNLFIPQPKFHFSNAYESIVKEKEFLFYSHRGPPVV